MPLCDKKLVMDDFTVTGWPLFAGNGRKFQASSERSLP